MGMRIKYPTCSWIEIFWMLHVGKYITSSAARNGRAICRRPAI
jgi:hypothetical protein